jgi:hypothetical protein
MKNVIAKYSQKLVKMIGRLPLVNNFRLKKSITLALTTNWVGGFLVVLISWGMYFAYIWPQMLYFDESGLQAGWINVWGDWAAHITYANVFALKPVSLWLSSHPIHINSLFTYPFLADAISGLLIRAGMDLVSAFIVPSIVITMGFLGAVYGLYFSLLKRGSRAVIALTLFLLNGGWGVYWLVKDWLAEKSLEAIAYPKFEATHISDQNIEWISIITSEMIPQRSFLLGFPITILVVWQLHKWWRNDFKNVSWKRLLALGSISGTLLFIHAHSFIALFVICVVFSLWKWRHWRRWLGYALATALIALPIAWFLHGENLGGFIRWLPGWYANSAENDLNLLYFWWINYGLFLPIALWGTWRYRFYRQPLVISGWVLFVAVNLIQFQPHIWDNTKILTWVHLFLVIPVATTLFNWWQWRRIGKYVTVLVFLLVTASGWLDTWRLTRVDKNSYEMWSYEDFKLANTLNSVSSPGDIALTGQNHNNWATALTHVQALMGFPGWMWTYGVTDPQLAEEISQMYRGSVEAEQLLEKYHVKYVIIGSPERHDLKANQAWYEQNYPILIQSVDYTVFQITAD